jgi:hypothetical protein
MIQDPSSILQSGKPDLWPLEFWQLIIQLAERAKGTAQPRLSLTTSTTPNYVSPVSDTQYEFNLALSTLEELEILDIRWKGDPGSQAAWIRLRLSQREALENIIENYSPMLPQQRMKSQDLDWKLVHDATQRYGSLGLRTAAHIAFGSSHSLDTISLPPEFQNKVWIQADAIPVGSDVIRVGGLLEFQSPSGQFIERWSRPGHSIWSWDVEELQIEKVGQKLILIENPYPYWELLSRLKGLPISLICLHGETRHHIAAQSALGNILGRVYEKHPHLDTYIWCDPDPGGIFIANNAFQLVKKLGVDAKFLKMGAEIFEELDEVLLSQESVRPISQIEKDWLRNTEIHPELLPLANLMLSKEIKGEQEALAVTITFGELSL